MKISKKQKSERKKHWSRVEKTPANEKTKSDVLLTEESELRGREEKEGGRGGKRGRRTSLSSLLSLLSPCFAGWEEFLCADCGLPSSTRRLDIRQGKANSLSQTISLRLHQISLQLLFISPQFLDQSHNRLPAHHRQSHKLSHKFPSYSQRDFAKRNPESSGRSRLVLVREGPCARVVQIESYRLRALFICPLRALRFTVPSCRPFIVLCPSRGPFVFCAPPMGPLCFVPLPWAPCFYIHFASTVLRY